MVEKRQRWQKTLRKNRYPRKDKKFPIFLLGTGRCGSTLLQKILNSVEPVMIYGEHGGFLKDIARAYFLNLENEKIEKYIMNQNISGIDPGSVFNVLKDPQLWCAWTNWYNRETVKYNFQNFIESFFNPVSLKQEVHWGFKEIRYGLDDRVIQMLSDLYPEARFIFIVRNPVDVVASKISARMSDGIETDSHNWVRQNTVFLEFYEKNDERSTVIRYENVVGRDRLRLKRLFDWLGFPISEKQYTVIDITKPSEAGRPRRMNLSFDEIDRINGITKETRYELGYFESSSSC